MVDIPPDDGLKWFGEGFDGFPKRLPDDCMEYVVHVIDQNLKDPFATRSRLNQIRTASIDLTNKLLKDYIWQRDAFELKLLPSPASQDPGKALDTARLPHLRGRTHFGDSIADEWLIVYLLVELGKQCPDAWIRVYDTDGEFLLIEAANVLPKWLNPQIAENRVWINHGHLRIVPLDEKSTSRNLSLQDAQKFLRQTPEKLVISPFVEDEAFYRLREYPSAITSSLHHAVITIPRKMAHILHCNPAYISPAVESFYLRDPVSLKPLTTKDLSTLRFPPQDFVTVSVKFTKVGFAQLRSQLFDAPPAWTGVIPRLRDPKVETGMKITCGFEMLLSDPQNQDKRVVREIKVLLEELESSEEVLPTDAQIAEWPKTQDDEKWLEIDYNDFEKGLSGSNDRRKHDSRGAGFGDHSAQEKLHKMVSRFEDFLKDDTAGAEGLDDDDMPDDEEEDDDDGDVDSDAGEDNDVSLNEQEFEQAMKATMSMPAEEIETTGLLDEARRLAVEDAEDDSDINEDEDMKKVMEIMEKELKGHGALKLNQDKKRKVEEVGKKPVFGPERPPHMLVKKKGTTVEEDEDDIGPGDEELSSDDEDFNDVDLGLAKNMLESFKGQAGMSGPAGNLMRALGVNMPRDEGGDNGGGRIQEVK